MNTNIIIFFLVILILGVSLSFYQYQYGNHWICSQDNRCSKKVFFGNFKNKSDCLSVCKIDKNDTVKETGVQESYEPIVINNFQSSRVGIPLQNSPLVTPTDLPQPTERPSPQPSRMPTQPPMMPSQVPTMALQPPTPPPRQASVYQSLNSLPEPNQMMSLPSGVRNTKNIIASSMINNNTKNLNKNGYTNPDYNSIRPRYNPGESYQNIKDNSVQRRANKVADTHVKIPENMNNTLNSAGYEGLTLK